MMFFRRVLIVLALFSIPYSQAATVNPNQSLDALNKQILEIEVFLQSPTSRDDATDANAWKNLGLLYQTKDVLFHQGGVMQPVALNALNKALELDDNNSKFVVQVNQQKGILLKTMGRPEESILASEIVFDRSTSNFDKSAALSMRADAHILIGNVGIALGLYNQALDLTPYQLSIYLPLAECHKEQGMFSKDDWNAMFTTMENAVEKYEAGDFIAEAVQNDLKLSYLHPAQLSNVLTSEIYWAMYTAAEKASLLDKAWKHLKKAHQLDIARKKSQGAVSKEDIVRGGKNIISIFTHGFWSPSVGSSSEKPIFIVGMMRSGSTLLETMLDAHPSVWGLGEDSIFNSNLRVFRDELVAAANNAAGAESVSNTVLHHSRVVLDKMNELADIHFSNTQTSSAKTARSVTKITDKMLFNYKNIGFIHMMFPRAAILHTMRDPMDTLFSCYRHKFDDIGLEWALDVEKLVLQYVSYLEIVHHFRQVLPDRVLDIRYEAVVADNEKVMRAVTHSLGLQWDPSVLDFHTSNRTVQTHSMHQVRQKIYSQSVGAWRKHAKQLQPIIKEFLKYVPDLRKRGVLVYPKQINWNCDVKWDYNNSLTASEWEWDSQHSEVQRSFEEEEEDDYDDEMSGEGEGEGEGEGDGDHEEDEGVDDFEEEEDEEEDDEEEEEVEEGNDEEEEDDQEDDVDSRRASRMRMRRRGRGSRRRTRAVDDEDEDDDEGLDEEEEEEEEEEEDDEEEEEEEEWPRRRGKRRQQGGMRRKIGRERRRARRPAASTDDEDDDDEDDDAEVSSVGTGIEPGAIKGSSEALQAGQRGLPGSARRAMADATRAQDRWRAGAESLASVYDSQDSAAGLLDKYTQGSRNKYLQLLSEKGVQTSALPVVVKDVIRPWTHTSVDSDVDYLLGIAHIFLHFGARGPSLEIFGDVLAVYRSAGLLSSSSASSDHAWREDSIAQGALSSPVSRAFIGLGSCLALDGKMKESLAVFDDMLLWDPNNMDGLIKRAEVLSGLGQAEDSLSAYHKLISLGGDCVPARLGMGGLLFQQKMHELALDQFLAAKSLLASKQGNALFAQSDPGEESVVLNRIGKCYRELGEQHKAIAVLKEALVLDPKSKEIIMDIAVTHMELGEYKTALPLVEKAIRMDPQYQYAFGYRGLLKHTLGWPRRALRDLLKATQFKSTVDHVVAALTGVCYSCLGQFHDSIRMFNTVLSEAPSHHVWFRREMAYYYLYRQDRPLKTYSYDEDLRKEVKHGMSQHDGFSIPPAHEYSSYRTLYEAALSNTPHTAEAEASTLEKAQKKLPIIEYFVNATSGLSKLIQLDHPGFLPNQRQHRQFGLAVLQIAQSLREHVALLYEGKGGLPVLDSSCSSVLYTGWRTFPKEHPAHADSHVFSWRDLFDICVRWRQLSEPMDVVYWLDRMNLSVLKTERVGLSTYMLSGTKKIARYFSYNDWAFNITKDNLANGGYCNTKDEYRVLPPHLRRLIPPLSTHKELFDAVGGPFYQVLPVESMLYPGVKLNGTRLTLQSSSIMGYDFTICSASTDERTKTFQLELAEAYLRLERAMLKHYALQREGGSEEQILEAKIAVTEAALQMFYYWVNFAPITRGTSATGYASLLGVVLALGEEPAAPVPHMTQYDWVAMFSPHPSDFVSKAMLWIGSTRRTAVPDHLLDAKTPPLPENGGTLDLAGNGEGKGKEGVAKEMQVGIDGTEMDTEAGAGERCPGGEYGHLRVVDVFDSIRDVFTAMNAFGESDYT